MDPIDTRQSILEDPSRGSKQTMYFPCFSVSTYFYNESYMHKVKICTTLEIEYCMINKIDLNDVVIFFRNEQTCCVGRSHQIDKQIIGKNIQFFHFFTLDICSSRDSIPLL